MCGTFVVVPYHYLLRNKLELCSPLEEITFPTKPFSCPITTPSAIYCLNIHHNPCDVQTIGFMDP